MLVKKEIMEEYLELIKTINKWNVEYYENDNPSVSDTVYDLKYKRLKDIEKEYPSVVNKDSPTQKVGGEVKKELSTIVHTIPMLSLSNAYDMEDLAAWYKLCSKRAGTELLPVTYEPKYDGIACSLKYKDRKLITAATRGDGRVGESIIRGVLCIQGIPHELGDSKVDKYPRKELEIRGEIVMPKANLEQANELRRIEGKTEYANCRNAVAGILRTLTPDVRLCALLMFIPYDMSDGKANHCEPIGVLKKKAADYGFVFNSALGLQLLTPLTADSEHVMELLATSSELRESMPVEIDGIVFKVNDTEIREQLGVRSKSPIWAIAYKFANESGISKLTDVEFQVGAMGAVTPVAKFEPVEVCGVVITSASLYNFDEIRRLGIKIGDSILVERAADVIPKVKSVIKDLRPLDAKEIEIPVNCPSCSTKLERVNDEVVYRCTNYDCGEQRIRRLTRFVAKKCMNIKGLSDKTLVQLIKEGLVKNYADIYKLEKEDLLKLEGFKDKSADNLIKAIDKTRKAEGWCIINAMCIRGVGESTAKVIAGNMPVTAYKKAHHLLEGCLGEETLESVLNWFKERGDEILEPVLQQVEVLHENEKLKILSEFTYCITGSFEGITRDEIKAIIENAGGKVSSSVSGKTSALIVGENAGSKAEKAKKLGVSLVSIETFFEFIHSLGIKQ